MTSSAKSRVLTFVALSAVVCPIHSLRAQGNPTLETRPATGRWSRECGPDAQSVVAENALVGLRGRNGAVLTGAVRDSAGQPIGDAHITFSGVKGEWRADIVGGFTIAGIPPGSRAVNVSATGFAQECRVVNFVVRDTTTIAVSLVRGVKKTP